MEPDSLRSMGMEVNLGELGEEETQVDREGVAGGVEESAPIGEARAGGSEDLGDVAVLVELHGVAEALDGGRPVEAVPVHVGRTDGQAQGEGRIELVVEAEEEVDEAGIDVGQRSDGFGRLFRVGDAEAAHGPLAEALGGGEHRAVGLVVRPGHRLEVAGEVAQREPDRAHRREQVARIEGDRVALDALAEGLGQDRRTGIAHRQRVQGRDVQVALLQPEAEPGRGRPIDPQEGVVVPSVQLAELVEDFVDRLVVGRPLELSDAISRLDLRPDPEQEVVLGRPGEGEDVVVVADLGAHPQEQLDLVGARREGERCHQSRCQEGRALHQSGTTTTSPGRRSTLVSGAFPAA